MTDTWPKHPFLSLQERVRQFNLGTPTPMHVGTHELVNDLWRELEKRSENHVALAAEQKRDSLSSTGDLIARLRHMAAMKSLSGWAFAARETMSEAANEIERCQNAEGAA